MDMNLLAYSDLYYFDYYYDGCCLCQDRRVCAYPDPQRRCGLVAPDPRLWYLMALWMVDGDVDEAPRAGFVSVPLLTYAAAVFAAVAAVELSTPTAAAKTPRVVDANPPTAAQAVVASNRYCPVERAPRFASQSDATAG
jgi:hypothetical protein